MAVETLPVRGGRVRCGSSPLAAYMMSLSYSRMGLAWGQTETGVQACIFHGPDFLTYCIKTGKSLSVQ